MAERADILDTCSYRFNATAENALTAALAIQNVNGVLSQVDEFGNVTPLIGGTTPGLTGITGDVLATGPGTVNSTIQPGVVTYAKIQNVSNAVLLGNNSGGAASVQELTAAQARTLLSLVSIATTGSAADLTAGTLPAGRFPALTGDVTTVAGALATTITANSVTLAKMAQMATGSLLGRSTAGTGNVEVITVGSGLSISGGTLSATGGGGTITALTGDVTASGSGSVVATIAANAVTTGKIAANAVTLAKLATQADQTILGNNTGGVAVPLALTAAQTRTLLGLAAIATSGSATDLTAGTVPAARMPALTGDVTTSAGAVATTLAASGVTAATYAYPSSITFDAKGRATAATAGTAPQPLLSLTNKDVLYATGASTVGQNANFQFDSATTTLSVPTVTVSTAVQGGAGSVLALNNKSGTPDTSIGLTSSNVQITGTVSSAGSIAPATDLTYSLGAGGKAWSALWVDTIAKTSVPGTIAMVTSQGVQIDSNTTGNVLITHQSTSGRFISDATGIGFFPVVGGSPVGVAQQTVTGSRGGNAALASLLTKLAAYGLIVDSTSP